MFFNADSPEERQARMRDERCHQLQRPTFIVCLHFGCNFNRGRTRLAYQTYVASRTEVPYVADDGLAVDAVSSLGGDRVKMRSFMDYLQHAFYDSSRWDVDNSYSNLTYTAREDADRIRTGLLFFDTPTGLKLNVSSLASPNFAHTYALGSVGLVHGSLSYFYSSLPVSTISKSLALDLRDVVEGYRHVQELQKPHEVWSPQKWRRALAGRKGARAKETSQKDTLLYGRLYLPQSSLEALYLRRVSPSTQVRISCVSDSVQQGASVLALVQRDVGKHSMEYLYSTDSALLGVRGLYNFGPDPRERITSPGAEETPSEQLHGRFSAGGELYYGLLNKSGGISTGFRFTTLPRHSGFPYTMTLTVNPLMGNLSSTYAVKAGRNIALCSQFDFNFYSYESDLRIGCEIWRRQERQGVEWMDRMIRQEWKKPSLRPDDDVSGVLKARWDQNWNVAVLWEGRIQELLFSMGVSLQRGEQIFKAVGVELQYSS